MKLTLENVELYYNRVHALRDLSLEVNEGEIVSLLGNNGAGKTSTLSMISAPRRRIFFGSHPRSAQVPP